MTHGENVFARPEGPKQFPRLRMDRRRDTGHRAHAFAWHRAMPRSPLGRLGHRSRGGFQTRPCAPEGPGYAGIPPRPGAWPPAGAGPAVRRGEFGNCLDGGLTSLSKRGKSFTVRSRIMGLAGISELPLKERKQSGSPPGRGARPGRNRAIS